MKKVLSVLVAFCLVMGGFTFSFAEDAQKTIVIVQTSDLHGRLFPHDYATDSLDADAGLLKVSTFVNEIRSKNKNVLLMDSGDTLQDNSAELFNAEAVHPMTQAMNEIGYDLWTLGNHEFNFGLDFLNKNIMAFKGDVLSNNITYKDSGKDFVKPYVIKDIDGVRVAIIGFTPSHIPLWEASTPDHFENLAFAKSDAAIAQSIKELEGKYDVLVGSLHLGPDGEYDDPNGIRALAEKYPQFDVIFGGHAHSQITETVNGVLLMEPGAYGTKISKAVVTVAGDNVSVEGELVSTQDIEVDEKLAEKFAYVHDKSVANANTIVGKISSDFIKRVDYLTGDSKVTTMPTAQLEDNAVIDLINKVQMHYTGAEISSAALFNMGSNLVAGDFKKKDVAFIYKYDNTLMGVKITGENLKAYMEWSASYYNTFKPGDLTVSFNQEVRGYNYDMFSGLTYEINLSKEAGKRVENIKVNGKALDPKKVYKLAVNNYRMGTLLTNGWIKPEDKYYDSVAKFNEMPDGRIRDLIIKYTKENSKGVLKPEVDKNWKLTGFSINPAAQSLAVKKILAGSLEIPKSEDGRTMNVAPITMDMVAQKYVVRAGDVLWRIAKNYQTTWQLLQQINQIKNPNLIYINQEIIIPQ